MEFDAVASVAGRGECCAASQEQRSIAGAGLSFRRVLVNRPKTTFFEYSSVSRESRDELHAMRKSAGVVANWRCLEWGMMLGWRLGAQR